MAQEVQNGCAKAVTFSSLKPQLLVQAPKASDAVQFFKSAFGAEEVCRTMHPKRKADQELPLILSVELKLGSSVFIVSDQPDDCSPLKTEGNGFVLSLETEDVEGAIEKAVAAGAVKDGETTEGDVACEGGRVGKLRDPYGFVWVISSPTVNSADVAA